MTRSPSPSGGALITANAAIWAAAALLHVLSFPDWLFSVNGLLYLGAASWTLARPASRPRFILLLTLEILQTLVLTPNTGNHLVLLGSVSLSSWVALCAATLLGRRAAVSEARVFDGYAAYVRIELLILYAFAVLHKLNWGYFDPAVSCGLMLHEELASQYPLLPSFVGVPGLAIWGSLAIEAAIPVLLCFPRTRRLGLLVACVFHLFLSLHTNLGPRGLYSFSVTLFASYFFFAPREVARRLARAHERVAARWPRLRTGLPPVVVPVALALQLVGWALSRSDAGLEGWTRVAPALGWVLWFVAGVAAAGLLVRSAGRESIRMQPPLRSPLILIPVLLISSGLSPYLGLKTEYSFSMYSNLQTEGARWNHVFLPRKAKIFDAQEDLVEILDSSSEDLLRSTARGERLVFAELQRFARRAPESFTVRYRRGEVTHDVSRNEAPDHELFRSPGHWRARLMRFRPVVVDGPSLCMH